MSVRRSTSGAREASLRTAALPAAPVGAEVFVPLGYEPGYDYPLLAWLPGATGGPTLGKLMARVSLRNFVAVRPTARGPAALWRAIDRVRDRLSVHPRRLYLIGHGRAGTEALRIACRDPGACAGVVSLGGPFPLDEAAFARLDAVRRLPMLLCRRAAGTAADAAHADRTLRLFHAAGATLAMRIYASGPMRSATVLGDVNRWLMEDVCGQPSVPVPNATG